MAEKKPVTAKIKDSTIKTRVFKRGKDAKGNSYVKSTRGWKVKERAGDKKTTNKKGDEVTIRKSGNRVVKKRDAQGNVVRVVRKKKDGTKVITENRTTPKPRATGPYVTGVNREPNRRSPYSTFETTVTGREIPIPSSEYTSRRPAAPNLGKKKVRPTPKPGVKPKLGGR